MATRNRKTPATTTSPETRRGLLRMMADGAHDEQNPLYTFSMTDSRLLLALASGVADARRLAQSEMANRGLDAEGDCCSFEDAYRIWVAPAAAAGDLEMAQRAAQRVAGDCLKIDLTVAGSDQADFHDLSVWSLREALVAAYQAGAASK
jgi:hypothetical protein